MALPRSDGIQAASMIRCHPLAAAGHQVTRSLAGAGRLGVLLSQRAPDARAGAGHWPAAARTKGLTPQRYVPKVDGDRCPGQAGQ